MTPPFFTDPEADLGAATAIKAELKTIKFLLYVTIGGNVFLMFKNHF